MQNLSMEVKRRLYKIGQYVMGVPPVCTTHWNLDDWVHFVDASGHWITGTAKKIIDGNPSDKPLNKCDYYRWLRDNWSGHKIRDLRGYLHDRGFVRGRDILTEETIQCLRHCHEMYFFWEIKPKRNTTARA